MSDNIQLALIVAIPVAVSLAALVSFWCQGQDQYNKPRIYSPIRRLEDAEQKERPLNGPK